MNAHVSFNNIFGTQTAVPGVTSIRDGYRLMCDIDESLFEPPSHYTFIGNSNCVHGSVHASTRVNYRRLFPDLRKRSLEEDDDLLQYALQNSVIGNVEYDRDQVSGWSINNYKTTVLENVELLL